MKRSRSQDPPFGVVVNSWKSALFSLFVLLVLHGSSLAAQTGNVVISTDTTFASGTYQLTSLSVMNGATLTIGGGSTVAVSGRVLVTANSNVVLQSVNNASQVNGSWQGAGVTLNTGSVQVDAGSSINADGQGYVANAGPGGAAGGSSTGGSYGGAGGTGVGPSAAAIYGTAATPTDLGSGGSSRCCGSVAGAGGGAVRIIVSGTLTINGIVSANGGNIAGYQAGGGAGGSVYVTTGALAGSGLFSAAGGSGGEGAGGGGRIAVYYNAAGSSFTGFAAATAVGGSCGNQCSHGTASAGSTGTSAFFDTSAKNDNLMVDQDLTIPAGSTISYNSINVQSGATLTIGGGSSISVASAVTVSGTLIAQSINTSAQINGSWQGSGVTLHAASVVVNPGGSINADGQGYLANGGPGGAPGSSAGGSYGGLGGVGDGVSPAGIYGSTTAPTDLGSGGGSRCCGTIAGLGGGAIRLVISGTLTDNGIISANGGNGIGFQVGGGSGGTLSIQTGTLTGSGSIAAGGGSGGEAGGGGGRIALYYNTNNGFNTTLVTSSGGASSSGNPGAVGTVYTLGAGSNLTVSDNTTLPANSNLSFNSVTVNNGATLTVGSGSTLASKTLTVTGGGIFDVGGGSTLNISGLVMVTANSNLVLQSINNAAQISGTWQGQGVTLNAGSVQVDAGSSINADGQGYVANAGPGGAPGGSSTGGSYGGSGGVGIEASPAPIYGSNTMPADLGSGGSSRCCGSVAGAGGGAVRLIVSGTLTDNGVISANGGNIVGYQAGAGSGGSVYVTTAALAGAGVFTANGGTGGEAAGGGGRIAVYYNGPSSRFTGFGTSTSNGGTCGSQCSNGTSSAGSTGTVGFFDTSATNDNLMVDQDLTIPAGTTVSYNSITVQKGATLTIGGGSTIKAANTITVSGTLVAQSINNSAQINGIWQGDGVTFNAKSVVVNTGGSINADGQGYLANAGPGGAPGGTSAGGSYGGLGGVGDGASATPIYGSDTMPTDLGSGGSSRCCGSIAGTGGGAIRMIVSGTLTDNGVISANGANIVGYQAGGGAGGSVYVTTAALAGSGVITANGGAGGEAGGGGGRIAVYYNAPTSSFTGFQTSTSNGGGCATQCSNTTTSPGAVGTAGFFDTSAANTNLMVDQDLTIPAGTAVSYNSITVQPNATLTIGGGATVTVANSLTVSGAILAQTINNSALVNGAWQGSGVTLNAASIVVNTNGSISADAQGYVAGAGPGGAPAGSSTGGSYGGPGGFGSGASTSPAVYGSTIAPTDLGSGGATRCCGTLAGAGGGALTFNVSESFTNDGIVSANGGAVVGYQAGGGSGGSIYVKTKALTGSGAFTVNGGIGGEAGGGGGRLAIYYNAPSSTFTGFAASTATGGACGANGNSSCANATTSVGGNGTAAFFDTSAANTNLAIYQNFTIAAGASPTYNTVNVENGALLTLGGGSALTVGNALTVSGTVIAQSANNKALVNGVWAGSGVAINAASLTINSNGSVNADTQGYVADAGPGAAPAGTSAGASYGGLGGVGDGASPSPTYGSLMEPVDLGSGGGSRCCGTVPGSGGGALLLTVSGTLTDNGVISANGGDGTGLQVGGGSGGSVYIRTATLAGSGTIAASGGTGGEAGGGGGRVALYFNTNAFNLALATATGGASSNGNPGAVGTVYIQGTAISMTALTVSPAQLTAGQTAAFQAVVTAATGGPAPAGTVKFLDGATVLGTQAAAASQQSGTAVAQFQTAALTVGTHSITASYSGDANVKASTSAAQTVTVAQAISTTSLAISAASITTGQSETLTAKVTGLTSPAITGNITFFDGTTSLGNETLTVTGGTGTATLTVPSFAVGSHSITARYNGDTNYAASSSAAQTVTVGQITSATALRISAANISAGQPETLTASISGAATPAPTGVVTFFDGTTSIGTGNVTPNSKGGTATLTLTTFAAGTHSLLAHYGGDTNYTASLSAAQILTVSGTSQTITFPVIPNHTVGDAPFTLTATASSNLAVTYTVTSGPATVSGNTVTLAGAAGAVTIQASQAGDATYAAAPPVSRSFTVSPPTALSLTSISPDSAAIGSPATTITLTGTNFSTSDIVQLNGATIASAYVSPTSLTAVLPASFFTTAGTGSVTVQNPDSGKTSGAAVFTVSNAPQVVFSGPPTSSSGSQPTLTFNLVNPYPVALAGTLTLTFAPATATGINDPAVQFSQGGRTLAFDIPANSTVTPTVQLQTGTVAGTATVALALTANGVGVTPANVTPVVITIPPAVPTITSTSITRDGSRLTLSMVGYSNTREATKAVIDFTPVSGGTLSNPVLTLDVSTSFTTWYSSTPSNAYGSAFTYTQIFTLNEDAAIIQSVKVVLANSVGDSTPATAQ